MENLFIKASRIKLRVNTESGQLTVEDLWDLPLLHERKLSLNSVAVGLHTKLRSNENISFVETSKPKTESPDELAMEIVKHIIAVKQDERRSHLEALDRTAKKERIMELIAQKENESLSMQSIDDLREQLKSL